MLSITLDVTELGLADLDLIQACSINGGGLAEELGRAIGHALGEAAQFAEGFAAGFVDAFKGDHK